MGFPYMLIAKNSTNSYGSPEIILFMLYNGFVTGGGQRKLENKQSAKWPRSD
jgi:hypothetical protein